MLCYKLNNNYFDGVANVYNSLIYAFNAMCFNFVDELKHKPEYWQGGSIFMMCELNGILLLTLLLSFFVPSINQKSQIEVDKFSETIKESADDIKNRLTTKYRGTLGVAIQSIEAFSPGLKGAIRSIKKFFETEEERQLPRSRAHRRR
ncbi:hypothetical protein DC3_33510 [Deinococcus cellulosilyticus NBRC 106333 = KACC 11606]|uniref:Uncharacterized protein n=2 Tax=Deinococcus cellulosilyticus TaxID=401558 RepID=A0A511N5L6_DEIC1|nr:hypothetical protein DC3_33510 [Deinococcus cellulosilyticus NBRC 106333 = KACC 11606]